MSTFTPIDKSLLQRTARRLDAEAQALYDKHAGIWPDSKGPAAKDKLEHDRLRRDARDVRALAGRLHSAGHTILGMRTALVNVKSTFEGKTPEEFNLLSHIERILS